MLVCHQSIQVIAAVLDITAQIEPRCCASSYVRISMTASNSRIRYRQWGGISLDTYHAPSEHIWSGLRGHPHYPCSALKSHPVRPKLCWTEVTAANAIFKSMLSYRTELPWLKLNFGVVLSQFAMSVIPETVGCWSAGPSDCLLRLCRSYAVPPSWPRSPSFHNV